MFPGLHEYFHPPAIYMGWGTCVCGPPPGVKGKRGNMARKKHIVLSSVSGVAALVVINLTAGITGVGLGYTLLSIGTSVLLGLPGVALLLLGNLL